MPDTKRHADPVPADVDEHTLGELRLMRDIAAGFELWDNVAEIDRRIARLDGLNRAVRGGLMIDLGEIAYNAYGDNRGWVVFSGAPMPTWEEQSPELREAWDAAAQAVAAALGPGPVGSFGGAEWAAEEAQRRSDGG